MAGSALERMVDNGFSQIPVTDKAGRIIGVFSWKSFGKRVADLYATSIKTTELPIREAMEPARFIDPEVYIDTETDWSDIDHVLVGTCHDLKGILCISDVHGRVNDFAEAFVLLYEIEHEIRDLIRDVVDDDELAVLISHGQEGLDDATPVRDRGCRSFSPSDGECQKWRRRGSNPRPAIFP